MLIASWRPDAKRSECVADVLSFNKGFR